LLIFPVYDESIIDVRDNESRGKVTRENPRRFAANASRFAHFFVRARYE